MRPTRKSRSVNKWHGYLNDVYSVKDVDNSKRNNHQKRDLPDTPQWSTEELSHFYEAYREYGKDWKKVAAVVGSRSVEMVESLYTMNKAYLSLPEGTASVVGLVAMMSDHYSNLARSDCEQENNDGATTSLKHQKRARSKAEASNSKGSDGKLNAHSLTLASSYGCLPSMKTIHTGGSRPHAAGQRTPRFPVSYSCQNIEGEKFLSLSRQGLKKNADVNDDDATNQIGLALTEALAKGGSPQFSQTPNRRTESVKWSAAQNAEMKHAELKMANAKHVESDRDDEDLKGRMQADTGELCRHSTYLKQGGRVSTLVQKSRNSDEIRLDVDGSRDIHLDNQTEVGQKLGAVRKNLKRDARISRASHQGSKKKSKKVLFSRDEASAIEALQTLADLSLKMPSGGKKDVSMMQIREEKDDHLYESGLLEATPDKNQREKHRSSGVRVKEDRSISGSEVASNRIPKMDRVSVGGDNAFPEMENEASYQPKTMRKKSNMLKSKIQKPEAYLYNHIREISGSEARDLMTMSRSKRYFQNASPKIVKDAEHSSMTHPRRAGSYLAQSTGWVCQANQVNLPTTRRSRRKMHLKKPKHQKDLKFPDKLLYEQSHTRTASVEDTDFTLKEKLINCFSNHGLRRWCMYEWFYSAIDYPWFAKREFVEYLHHVGLGNVPKLTRVEWSVIRSSLGKPRRFSQQLLKEEKEKLNQYRDSVRKHCTDIQKGTHEGLPEDLARSLSVGQRVVAIHPKAREIHDGNVLTVDHCRCRVQFDRPELGVQFVMDIDCMPLNHSENVQTPFARHITFDKYSDNNGLRMNEQEKEHTDAVASDKIENINGLPHLSPSTCLITNLLKLTKVASEDAIVQTRIVHTETSACQEIVCSQPCTLAQIQAKDAKIQALAALSCALDKKEAVVLGLKHANNDLVNNCSLKESESLKKQYAAILVQLHEANEQVCSSLSHLRQQKAFQETISIPWPGSVANLGDHGGPLNSLDHSACQPYPPGSHVNEIIGSSRTKAGEMVHVAIQTLSLKGRANTSKKIEEAIDIVNEQLPLDDSFTPLAPDSMLPMTSDGNHAQIPSELITQCVASLLMIQKCTERQFPPADIAHILHSAVTNLKPCCSQNLPAYAEIEKCMGMIKNQILSRLPS